MRFLWWDDYASRKISYFRHCRVVLGVSSSPFLLSATLSHHLEKAPDILKETADILKESFYVDNCVTSLESEADLNRFVEESQILLSAAKFELRGWASNAALPEKIYKSENDHMFLSDTSVPVLGLLWDVNSDELYCNINSVNLFDKPITKRSLLSISHRLFDPIGFTCPFTLIPKLLLQEVWKLKLRWDDELPHDVLLQFDKWIEDLHYLTSCRIPRRFSDCIGPVLNISLHTFADASKLSYATCIFIRVKVGEHVSVQLVEAKARLAPTKPMTIPRLELMAALIASRLLVTVKSVLKISDCKYYFWTDSMVALAWIKTKGNWSTFVGNRCNEISRLTNPDDWYHVPGVFNAADLPSRGCSGRHLAASKWWKGPDWLKDSEDQWPTSEITIQEEEVNQERRKSVVTSVSVEEPKFTEQLNNVNQYTKTVRVIGWIFRFCNNTKGNKTNGELNGSEVKNAETKLLRCIQSESFKELTLKNIKMQIFTDENNLLRVKSKLTLMDDVEDFKYPILLPSNHRMVVKLIIEKHSLHFHAGINTLVSILRQNFWILKCRKTVKKIVSRCSICKRHKVKPLQTPPPPLPLARVNDSKAFETTGVDIAGPLYLKEVLHVTVSDDLETKGPAIVIKKLVHDSVLLPCYVEKLGENNVRWYKEDTVLWDHNNSSIQLPSNMQIFANQTLELSDLRALDAGDYTCQVVRPDPWGPINQVHTIEVLYPPQIRTVPENGNLEVELGQEIVMGCIATGVPPPVLTWSHKGEEIQLRDNRAMLRFKATDRKMSGNYQCTASNGVGDSAAAIILLKVIFPPEVGAERLWVHSSPGENAELVCNVFSDPDSKVEWFHEGREIEIGGRILMHKISHKHVLLIRNVLTSDFGYYTCKASNFLGRSQQSIHLSGVANAAVFKRGPKTSSPNNYTLIWEVDSYSAIIEYKLLFRKHQVHPEPEEWSGLIIPADSEFSGSIHSMSYTLSGLSPSTGYEAIVLSRNRFGWSRPSHVLRFSTLGGENKPDQEIPSSSINDHEEPRVTLQNEDVVEEVQENTIETIVRGDLSAMFSDQNDNGVITYSGGFINSRPCVISLVAISAGFFLFI